MFSSRPSGIGANIIITGVICLSCGVNNDLARFAETGYLGDIRNLNQLVSEMASIAQAARNGDEVDMARVAYLVRQARDFIQGSDRATLKRIDDASNDLEEALRQSGHWPDS